LAASFSNWVDLQDGYGGSQAGDVVIARYKKLFRSSPEAAVLAVYGLVDLVLLLAVAEIERVKTLLHALGVR
jgi:hypothetical protein